MTRLKLIAQVALGLVFVVFGLNGFFHFIPVPPMPDGAQAFIGAMINTGYLMWFVKVVEVAAGACLLLGIWVPLALLCLAPIILNIFMFHLYLAPSGLPMAVVIVGLELFLAWCYRETFRPALRFRG